MTAKTNKTPSRDVPDLQELFSPHLTASQQRDELLEQVKQLRAAGMMREAKLVRREADEIHRLLTELENEFRGVL